MFQTLLVKCYIIDYGDNVDKFQENLLIQRRERTQKGKGTGSCYNYFLISPSDTLSL